MSQKRKYACDCCGREIDNRYQEKGWIHLEGTLTVAHGIYTNGHWATDFLKNTSEGYDFCGWRCFCAKVESIREEGAKTLPDWPAPTKALP